MIDAKQKVRILVVEDNDLDARSLLRHLADASARVRFSTTHVTDLAGATAAVEAQIFDCILLDLSLPDSHGLMGVEVLRKQAPQSPIVVLTGLEDPDVAVDAVKRGAQDYLTKSSIDSDRVTRAVTYAITRHRSEDQLKSVHEQLNVMNERERIARDLHDGVIQQLFASGMSLQAVASQTTDSQARARLLEAVDRIDDGIRQLRETIFGIHRAHEELSVVEDIDRMAKDKAEVLGFTPVIKAEAELGPIPADLHHDLLATVGEALSNVAKHAQASAVEVTVHREGDHLVLQVIDNGVGPNPPLTPASPGRSGFGLDNLTERAELHHGEFHIRPGPGGGTTLTWTAELPTR